MRAGVARRQGAVLGLAGAAVLLRLAYLPAPEGGDEGGYLTVARQWHGAGSSLYGRYWVDRPPLLIMVFQLADVLGGLPGLRIIAALGAGAAVLGVAEVGRRVGGSRAALWGAAIAAALFASPQLGTVQVNGELLAAPLVAWSIVLCLHAIRPAPGARAAAAAFGAGALAVAALLVKQNMAEPLLFAVVTVFFAWRAGALPPPRVRRVVAGATAGALTLVVLVGGWTMIRGTSLSGVLDAMYPFRIRAARLLATVPDQGQADRSSLLLHAWITSGVLLLVAAFAWAVVRRRSRGPVVWGVSATLVWATASVLLGGGFWDHYLVELIVPVAMAGGLALGRAANDRRTRAGVLLPSLAAGLVVVVALTHWTGGLGARMSNRGAAVGTAIGKVAAPGDTLVTAVGDAETVEASGLTSPYPYLWTLPAQVDDPHLALLTGVLEGPDAPTWLVVWDRPSFPAPVRARLEKVVATHYRTVGEVCGHPVLLRAGVSRPSPLPEPCDGSLALQPGW